MKAFFALLFKIIWFLVTAKYLQRKISCYNPSINRKAKNPLNLRNCLTLMHLQSYLDSFSPSPFLNSPWKKKAWKLILIWMKMSTTRDLLICSFTVCSLLSLVNIALPGLEQISVVLFWITYNRSHIHFLSFIFFKRSRMLNESEQCVIINMQVTFTGTWLAGVCKTSWSVFFLWSHITVININ